jgi:N-acetylneuraminic acid mutarotase
MRYVLAFSAVGFAVLVVGCGGSKSGSTSSPTTYSVGGTLSGLNGTIVLQNNGGDTLTLAANGDFAFPTTLAPGSAFAVTIETQPNDQTCSITSGNASGTLTESETSIEVHCVSNSAVTGQWMWRGGSDSVGATGIYGSLGTSAATNTPGARRRASTWTDANGNFWLFGGDGTAATAGITGMLDDVWEYVPPASGAQNNAPGVWTWVAGSSGVGAAASYGTLGTAAASDDPGAREGAASWRDSGGNLWLFGGDSLSGSSSEQFNDVWKFNVSSAQWVWEAGPSAANNPGSYGAQGVAASGNLPPARTDAITWTDSSGVFWLFGGAQLHANGSIAAVFNDLWSFNPQTLLWTWVGGSNGPDSQGAYGTLGIAAGGNLPPARMSGSAWVDASGNFWLFGGLGLSGSNISQQYGDLWEYEPGSQMWAWVGGSNLPDASGVYGTEGTGAASTVPGARSAAVAWTDSAGNFWMSGGYGYDAQRSVGNLNDLWEYNLSTSIWTWMSGSPSAAAIGNYGDLNTSASSNVPGARQQASGWVDTQGNLWLFGGFGLDALGNQQDLNDLWSYTPNP